MAHLDDKTCLNISENIKMPDIVQNIWNMFFEKMAIFLGGFSKVVQPGHSGHKVGNNCDTRFWVFGSYDIFGL